MALIACKNCGKNISDQATTCIHCGETYVLTEKVCPECNKNIPIDSDKCSFCGYMFKKKIKFKKNIKPKATKKQVSIKLVLLTIQLLLGFYALFNFISFEYGEKTFIVYLLPVILLLINSILIIINLIKKKGQTFLNIIEVFSIICAALVILIVGYNGKVYYIDYENNYDIMVLSDIYSKDTAKKLLKQMDDIFNYEDITGEKSNWRLSSFYNFEDEDYMLYIEDFNTNSYHGFTVNLENDGMIKNLYWKFNDDITLYLYKNGKKTENFYYYYIMYAYETLFDELDYDIGYFLDEKLDLTPNAEIVFEDTIRYNSSRNLFIRYGTVKDTKDVDFTITFQKVYIEDGANSLFDVANWTIEIN